MMFSEFRDLLEVQSWPVHVQKKGHISSHKKSANLCFLNNVCLRSGFVAYKLDLVLLLVQCFN